jgi:MFS family permease
MNPIDSLSDGGTRRILGFLEWPKTVSPSQKRSLIAGGLGWMLDAMDVMLYSMVLAELMLHLGLSKPEAGFLNSLTLAASAIGGLGFGVIADRVGRTRALMASILVYSLASFASGLSQTVTQLAFFRFVLGLGMGGEWSTGAALIAETWPACHRGKALGVMQSTYALGEMLAYAVVFLIDPAERGWRPVFFVGVAAGVRGEDLGVRPAHQLGRLEPEHRPCRVTDERQRAGRVRGVEADRDRRGRANELNRLGNFFQRRCQWWLVRSRNRR